MTDTTTTLVVGASGATGRRLVAQLLERGHAVKAVVRARERLTPFVPEQDGLSIIEGTILDLDDAALSRHLEGCDAVASCLGHTLSLGGMFGPPYRLVRDTLRRLWTAADAARPDQPVRFVLMSASGVRNRDVEEQIAFTQHAVIGLLRLLVPPHADNEAAAAYLRSKVGPATRFAEWVAVRPDGLTEAEAVTPYEVHASPIRSAIFDAGTTSRINVAHFMAELITDDDLWTAWQGQMPVIYNAPAPAGAT